METIDVLLSTQALENYHSEKGYKSHQWAELPAKKSPPQKKKATKSLNPFPNWRKIHPQIAASVSMTTLRGVLLAATGSSPSAWCAEGGGGDKKKGLDSIFLKARSRPGLTWMHQVAYTQGYMCVH